MPNHDCAECPTLGEEPARRQLELDSLQLAVIGETAVSLFPLKRGVMVIGRGNDADVRIESGNVSRRHARLFVREGFEIEDCGSRNGTFVRGQPVRSGEPVALRVGELVELGSSITLRVQPCAASTQSPSFNDDLDALLPRVAKSAISVILEGETGVGKEVAARRLHALSGRSAGPFVAINCGAISESLLESELFGYEKGAFTGAAQAKIGLIEAAHGGTVFFDEVGDMPAPLQMRLLRVLEQREVLRVGGVQPRCVDVRVVSATHRELGEEVRAGRFRQDLWFRLNGITLRLPPLRARRDAVERLAGEFAAEAAAENGAREVPHFTAEALEALRAHPWPGNVRELKNVVRRAVVLADGGEIGRAHLQLDPVMPPLAAATQPVDHAEPAELKAELRDLERQRILAVLESCGGNQTRAAKQLGIARGTLIARIAEYGLARPRRK